MKRIPRGLQPTPQDDRDFSLGAILTLPKLSELPDFFLIGGTAKDQGDTDYCTGYATCTASEAQEGVELDPEFSFAASKSLSGNPEAWGQDLRTACKAHVKIGALPTNVNYTKPKGDKARVLDNWTYPKGSVAHRRKKTYFKVTGAHDHFDNIRATLFKTETPIVTGVLWGWRPNHYYLLDIPKSGVGHAISIVGFDHEYLLLRNSFGTDVGMKGEHAMSREVVNHFVDKYGAYTFLDICREDAEYYLETGGKVDGNWLINLIRAFIGFIKDIIK